MVKTGEKTVYLLVGPRGAGKSVYSERLIVDNKKCVLVSRDEIMQRLFGDVHQSPYTGAHYEALYVMECELRKKLSEESDVVLILDTWTGDSQERRELLVKLRSYGADHVIALYFVTAVEKVSEWFWQKPGIARIGEMREKRGQGYTFFCDDTPDRDHKEFHKYAIDIDSDGFDEVIRVNPLEELISIK